jgi:HK97 family phage portal protein
MSRDAAAIRTVNARLRTAGGFRLAGNQRMSRRELELFAGARTIGLDPPLVPAPQPATEDEALGLPPFGRAVALLANAVASTDWYARRRDAEQGIYVRVDEQPSVLTDPFPLQTVWQYKWAACEDGILYGNHFALKGDMDWRTGRPGWMVPIPADQVWIATDPGRPGWYEWNIGGQSFSPDDIFHVSFGARSGEILGRGVLAQYAYWLGGAVAAEEYSRDTFAAGALPPAVITTANSYSQTQADDLKTRWRTLIQKREPIILPNGTELKPVVGNAEQAQLVEARKWNAQMVADAVGIAGWKLGLPGASMTYQNVETGDIDFVRDDVDRWARPLTDAISKWMLPGGWEAVWDYTSRMRSDSKTAAEVDQILVNAGIETVNEIRARRNLTPLTTGQIAAANADVTISATADDALEAAAIAKENQAGLTIGATS